MPIIIAAKRTFTANAALVEEAFTLLCRKYVQRADKRQQGMGLQYTEAETHDLAKVVARFAADRLQSLQASVRVKDEALRRLIGTFESQVTADYHARVEDAIEAAEAALSPITTANDAVRTITPAIRGAFQHERGTEGDPLT